MNLLDIAKHANVAPKTASRVFNNNPSVRPYIRERVLQSAKELNYRPNLLAKALRTNQLNILPIMIRDLEDTFYASLVHKLSNHVVSKFYEPLLCEDISRLNMLQSGLPVNGAILIRPDNKDYVSMLKDQKLITLMLDDPEPGIPNIKVDFEQAYSFLFEKAIEQGRKDFIYYYYYYGHYSSLEMSRKYQIFKRLGEKYNVNIHASNLAPAEFSARCNKNKTQTVLCENDDLALMLSHALSLDGRKVGKDIILIGCNGIMPFQKGVWSLKVDIEKLAGKAVSLMIEFLNSGIAPESETIFAKPIINGD